MSPEEALAACRKAFLGLPEADRERLIQWLKSEFKPKKIPDICRQQDGRKS